MLKIYGSYANITSSFSLTDDNLFMAFDDDGFVAFTKTYKKKYVAVNPDYKLCYPSDDYEDWYQTWYNIQYCYRTSDYVLDSYSFVRKFERIYGSEDGSDVVVNWNNTNKIPPPGYCNKIIIAGDEYCVFSSSIDFDASAFADPIHPAQYAFHLYTAGLSLLADSSLPLRNNPPFFSDTLGLLNSKFNFVDYALCPMNVKYGTFGSASFIPPYQHYNEIYTNGRIWLKLENSKIDNNCICFNLKEICNILGGN